MWCLSRRFGPAGRHDLGRLSETWATALSDVELARREALLQFDDAVNIQYTSGTTGSPKGATLSHHNILNNGYFVGEALHYSEEDRICLPVPFYHCFGCVLGNMAAVTHGCGDRPSGRVVRSRGHAARDYDRAVHVDLRRADHVHRGAEPRGVRDLLSRVAANRHHGGRSVPGRRHAARHRSDARPRRHDRLRHDRDVSGVAFNPRWTTRSRCACRP